MQISPVQAICSTTMILCSPVEQRRTMVWKIRVGKRFKERGQGLSRGMQCDGTRVQNLAGALGGKGISAADQYNQ